MISDTHSLFSFQRSTFVIFHGRLATRIRLYLISFGVARTIFFLKFFLLNRNFVSSKPLQCGRNNNISRIQIMMQAINITIRRFIYFNDRTVNISCCSTIVQYISFSITNLVSFMIDLLCFHVLLISILFDCTIHLQAIRLYRLRSHENRPIQLL